MAHLHIHNIDLHYHAGQERAEGVGLEEHLLHARLSGRTVLGITDHLGLYLNPSRPSRHYQAGVDGLLEYRAETDSLKDDYDDLTMYFAPEIDPAQDLDAIPPAVIEVSDFFIGEIYGIVFAGQHMQEFTDAMIRRMEELRSFSDATGREVYCAHPFRTAVNTRLIKRDPEPWISALAPRWEGRFEVEEISSFFMMDVIAVADAAAGLRLPLEVNGNTQSRVRSSNLPEALQMLWSALEIFRDRGVELVPGSDQHNFTAGIGRSGGAVPADCFHALGIRAEDIGFLDRVAASSAAGTT